MARLGGDGFVSILADCATVAQAQGLALLQAADHAMYGAKAQGKNHVQIKHIPNPSD